MPAFCARSPSAAACSASISGQASGSSPIEAVPLPEVVVALLQNAFDASAPAQRVALRVDQSQGVRLEIVDHGHGMSDELTARVGEPFVTTKQPGEGTGLGLWVVWEFVGHMGGEISVEERAISGGEFCGRRTRLCDRSR